MLNAPPTDDKDLIASIERKEFCIEVGKERQYHEWFFEGSTSRFVARITSKSTGCRSLEVESQTRQRVNLVFASVNKDLPAWFYSAAEMEGPEDLEFFRKQNEECRLIYGHVSSHIFEGEVYRQKIRTAQDALISIPLGTFTQLDGTSGSGNDRIP